MSVHLQDAEIVVRWYDEGKSFNNSDRFKAVATLVILESNHVFMRGVHGELSKQDMAELFEQLVDRGITRLSAERHGKLVERNLPQLLQRYKESYHSTTGSAPPSEGG